MLFRKGHIKILYWHSNWQKERTKIRETKTRMTLRRKVKLHLLSEQKIDMTRAIFSICTFTNVLISMFHVVTPAASNLAFFPLFFCNLISTRFIVSLLDAPYVCSAFFFAIFSYNLYWQHFLSRPLSLSAPFFLCYPNVYTSIYTEKSLCIQGKGLKETDKKWI